MTALAGAVAALALLGAIMATAIPSAFGAHRRAAGAVRPPRAGHAAAAVAGAAAPATADTHPASASGHGHSAGAAAHARSGNGPGAAAAPLTSCRAVAHVGDSTSVGMMSPADLPSAAQRLPAQYARVGVPHAVVDAAGGRSIAETLPGTVNGFDAARAIAGAGFHGCWVFALGTNDAADVAAGSAVTPLTRIESLMALAHGQPVLWVNVRTLDTAGPYAESNMMLWNAALTRAAHLYPNMRVYDWAAVARAGWFLPDGIHYTPAGYALRAHLIADALARAFPRGGGHTG